MLTNTLEEQMTNDKISWIFFLSDISSVFTTFPYFLKRKQQAFPPTIPLNRYVALFKIPVGKKDNFGWREGSRFFLFPPLTKVSQQVCRGWPVKKAQERWDP